MADQIYELQSIPLQRPRLQSIALAEFDQSHLLKITKGTTPLRVDQLSTLVELAAIAGHVAKAKVRVEALGILDYVEEDSLAKGLNQYVSDVASGRADISMSALHSKLAQEKETKVQLSAKAAAKNIVGYLAMRPKLLPAIEKLCRNDLQKYFKLSGVSAFSALQKKEEFLGLLNLLHQRQPKTILEIGTCKGGTIYMFSKVAAPDANIVTMDLKIANREIIESFGRRGQTVTAIEGDSGSPTTIQVIKNRFPNGIDFLFIDGDHSYEGVKRDFDNYSPLANSGGVIAFHDIVPDNRTRYGISTGGYSGGVHTFWSEVKHRYEHREFIANPKQDGAGIGALLVP